MYKCRICGTKFFHIYTPPKNWPKDQVEIDRTELCIRHWFKRYSPGIYKKYFKKSKD